MREYKAEKEYSVGEIIRYNLKMWWLAAILAAIFGVLLGGYKFVSLKPYVENEVYQDKMQVKASLYLSQFNDSSVLERGCDIMKIADSNLAYQAFCRDTGYQLTLDQYRRLFDSEQTETSNVVTFYITFPHAEGDFVIEDENGGIAFMEGVLRATDAAAKELTGQQAVTVLDKPYATKEVEKLVSYSISDSDYKKAILKALVAGVFLGIMIEVALYTLWMLLYKRPKNEEEIKDCLDTQVVDVFRKSAQNVESYKKAALFLQGAGDPQVISCLPVNWKTDDARKIAMCYANEQKKTLFISMEDSDSSEYSMSSYMLGKVEAPKVEVLNDHFHCLYRSLSDENGYDIAGSRTFATYLEQVRREYDYIVIACRDLAKTAEGFQLAKFSDKNLVLCNRKNTTNKELYNIRNVMAINQIAVDGVLVYDL